MQTQAPSWPRRARALAERLGLVLLSLMLVLAAAEGGLRLAGSHPPDPEWWPGDHVPARGPGFDAAVGWTLGADRVTTGRPSPEFQVTYRADGFGFRRPAADSVPFEADGTQLLFLGDSFTYGWGVEYEQAFPSLVGAALGVPVRNLGMEAFGVDQFRETFRHYGREAGARVVVAAWIDNDLLRSMTAYRRRPGGWWAKPTFRLQGDSLVPLEPRTRLAGVAEWARVRSRLVQAWRAAVRERQVRDVDSPVWQLNAAIFRALQRDVEAAGARLLVVRLPQKGQREASPATASLAGMGLAVLDLGALLPERPERLFYVQDPHFNAEGHAWAARHITARLEALGWLHQ